MIKILLKVMMVNVRLVQIIRKDNALFAIQVLIYYQNLLYYNDINIDQYLKSDGTCTQECPSKYYIKNIIFLNYK